MSQPSTEQAPDGPQQTPTPQEGEQPAHDVASLPRWAQDLLSSTRGEAAKYRTQLRELQPLAERAKQLEDAQKSEVQKAVERAEKAEREAQSHQRELLRHRVAAAKGVPAELLHGNDEAEMTAAAEQLLAFRGQAPPPQYDGGPRGGQPQNGMNDLIRDALARRGR